MLPYKKDIYGNFVIQSADLSVDIIQNVLPAFLTEILKPYPGQAVKVDVDYEQAMMIPLLKKLGFDFFYGSDDGAQWVYRNGSPMPQRAIVSSLRSCVVLIKDAHVLFTVQRNNSELIGRALLPGGNVNLNELPYDAGIREVQEETGLIVSSMKLVALLSRLNEGPLSLTATDFWYVCRDFTGTLDAQVSEIEQLIWVPIEVCASEKEHNGLKIDRYNLLIQHVLGRADKTMYSCAELNLNTPGYLQLIR